MSAVMKQQPGTATAIDAPARSAQVRATPQSRIGPPGRS